MDDLVVVQVIDGGEDLFNRLGCVFLCKSALVANAIKQLSTGGELRNYVELILWPASITQA